ncbi:MAG TPA: urease subunit alpha [Ktedonobacteraceae bacterium]|nr:urease subunit alpha [Ktedonobacteraceae bacterium]
MPFQMSREDYHARYGLTAGDMLRLGDTSLYIRIERDYSSYGDEVLVGFGKTVRDGLMANSRLGRESELDLVLTNAIIVDPVLGVIKGNIGVKEGRIAGIGRAGNPDISENIDLLIGTSTAVLPCDGLIATPGGIDSHVHLLSPRLFAAALSSGITTFVAMDAGPMWNVGVNPDFFMQRMFETFEDVPINVCFLARGCSSRRQGLIQSIEAGAGGLKIHEDLGAFPAVIDCCLSVAEQMDVAVAMHTDGLNESAELSDTIAAINGRAVHAYHAEGAGGGPYDLLEIVAQPNVIPSSTNPTIPFTLHTPGEHFDMVMTVHGLNPAFAEDILAARHRVRPETMAAETPLHDLGAISITASDSLGMGRIGETIARTWQMAHAMQEQTRPSSAPDGIDSNERVMRYLAKYTINPAIAHGLAQHVGTLEPGKLADIVLWQPDLFGVKPNLIIKGGMPAWGALGDGNAAVEAVEPQVYGPLFGGRGQAAGALSITFVSQASLDAGLAKRLRGRRQLQPVRQTRTVGKKDMLFNNATPPVHVHPVTHEVTINGERIGMEALNRVPLSRLYIVS